jgi:hypothetical protein
LGKKAEKYAGWIEKDCGSARSVCSIRLTWGAEIDRIRFDAAKCLAAGPGA